MHVSKPQTSAMHAKAAPANSAQSMRGDGVESQGVRFGDVLAESKSLVVQPDVGRMSPGQMFEASIQNTREGRKANLRQEYREAVDRRAVDRAESRTGVKARRSVRPPTETAPEVVTPHSVHDAAIRTPGDAPKDRGAQGSLHEHRVTERESAVPAKASVVQISAAPEKQRDGRAVSGEAENEIALASSGNMQSRSVSPASTGELSNPPAARELARLLAAPNATGGERGSATTLNMVATGSEQRPGQAAKVAYGARPSKDGAGTPSPQSTSSQSTAATEIERLIRLVRAQSGRTSSTRVLLDPPEMGRVHVRVSVEGDRIEVGVETENETARQLISARALKLKSALEQQGLVMDRFEVTTNQNGLFEPRFLAGQATPRPRQEPNGPGAGRGFVARSRTDSSEVQAAATGTSATARRLSGRELDVQV